jgi:hypothetical protein
VTIYEPGNLLNRTIPTPAANLALQISSGKVIMVSGAGVSKAAPTNLPLGAEIAHILKDKLSHTDLQAVVKDIADDNLLSIADAAEMKSQAALRLIQKMILDSFEFKTARPNYAHRCIALLMAERASSVMTTNWDTCIEREANVGYCDLIACRRQEELGGSGNSAVLLKLHGCATLEESIRVSSEQVREIWWAGHQISAAIERDWVVFLGIGSIAPYIKDTIKTIISLSKEHTQILVVDLSLSEEWDELMAGQNGSFFICDSAEKFLDDIISSLTLNQFAQVTILAKKLETEGHIASIDLARAANQTLSFLGKYPAHFLWLWVRRGIFPKICCRAVLESNFVRYLLAMAYINTISSLQSMQIISNAVSIICKDFIIELAWAKEVYTSDVLCKIKEESLLADRQNNVIPAGIPCVIIVNDPLGPLPAATMPESVVDTPDIQGIIDGPRTLAVRWLSLDQLLTIKNIDELHTLLGV